MSAVKTFFTEGDNEDVPASTSSIKRRKTDDQHLSAFLRNDMVGGQISLNTPYGIRPLLYADSTASSRCLKSIEDYIRDAAMPLYANTHSNSSTCGLQTTQYVHEARQIINTYVNGTDKDAVIFCGSGSTAAIAKMADILGMKGSFKSNGGSGELVLRCSFPDCGREFDDDKSFQLHARTHQDGDFAARMPERVPRSNAGSTPQSYPPLVIIGPMEHHSNILVWREVGARVLEAPSDASGRVNRAGLRELLAANASYPGLKVGAISAASNATGIMDDVDGITMDLHKHGFLALWDYASAAPHVPLDMNPQGDGSPQQRALLSKDAIFVSPHKFLGGPGAPGLLIVKKALLRNSVPSVPGGGTVFYVTSSWHRYLENYEEREEGGTQNILGAIKCGLVFRLYSRLDPTCIMQREAVMVHKALEKLKSVPNLTVLGPDGDGNRLPIVSFVVRYGGKLLHWNFVCALLNDLFGIQSRGGCVCAGPYAHRLLGIDDGLARALDDAMADKEEVLRPGFTRLSLAHYWTDETLDFVLDAVRFVATRGIELLGSYMFFPETGEWKHRSVRNRSPNRQWLHDFDITGGKAQWRTTFDTVYESTLTYADMLAKANDIADETKRAKWPSVPTLLHREDLRWFLVDRTEAEAGDTRSPAADHKILEQATARKDTQSSEQHLTGSITLLPWWQYRQPDQANGEATRQEKVVPVSSLEPQQLPQEPAPIACPLIRFAKPAADTKTREEKAKEDSPCLEDLPEADAQPEIRAKEKSSPLQAAADSKAAGPASLSKNKQKKMVPKALTRAVGAAFRDYHMIREGDRVLVAVSGGKDSLSLLHTMLAMKKRSPVRFDLAAMTVDPQFPGYDPSPLKEYMKSLGVEYFYESQNLIEMAKETQPSSICSWCARMKRGIMYSTARREGFNVIALGQHLDDLCESFVMSCLHNGLLRTMKAHYLVEAGDIRVIRPLVYVRERVTRSFATAIGLPVVHENCPACFEEPKERYRVKTLLAQQEQLFPALYHTLLKTIRPLMKDSSFVKAAGLHEAEVQQQELRGPSAMRASDGDD